ncbi:hypothetical protein C8T65DRAFT_695744 [Cerioporus squamosus]|nr:hypothetical protein C8T65DRAFT_695744 [Cerioporus squamosus]
MTPRVSAPAARTPSARAAAAKGSRGAATPAAAAVAKTATAKSAPKKSAPAAKAAAGGKKQGKVNKRQLTPDFSAELVESEAEEGEEVDDVAEGVDSENIEELSGETCSSEEEANVHPVVQKTPKIIRHAKDTPIQDQGGPCLQDPPCQVDQGMSHVIYSIRVELNPSSDRDKSADEADSELYVLQ